MVVKLITITLWTEKTSEICMTDLLIYPFTKSYHVNLTVLMCVSKNIHSSGI